MAYNTSSMLFMFSLVIMIMASTTLAQTPQDFLDPHNAARAPVGVRPLVWNQTLANYAMNYARTRIGDCSLIHSRGPYGENIAFGTNLSPQAAVQMWVDERQYYNYESNSCVGGQCLHYTQIVWADTTSVGCARVQCQNGNFFVICSYSPRGNIIGQRPFTRMIVSV